MAISAPNIIPYPAHILGIAGLIPFVLLAYDVITGKIFGTPPALYALQIYGAVILSFLGGIQWGLAVANSSAEWRRYVIGILPAIVAWASVWFAGVRGIGIMAAGYAMMLAYDLMTVRHKEAPEWYGVLRIRLTVIVVGALAITAQFGPF